MTDEELLERLGTSQQVADAIGGVTAQGVRNWKSRGIPRSRRWDVLQMAKAAGVAVDSDRFMAAQADSPGEAA